MIESGKGHKTNKNRVVLSLHEKARLIEESMNPGFNAKDAGVRYGININTVINIVKKKDQILGMVLIENERMAMEIQSNNEIGKANYYLVQNFTTKWCIPNPVAPSLRTISRAENVNKTNFWM